MSDEIRCPCESEDCGGLVMQRRCNTHFVDEASNLMTSCRHCYESAWRDRNGDWDTVPGGSPFADEPPSDAEIIAYRDNERLRAQLATLTAEVERKQTAFRVSVQPMHASNGITYFVCVDHPLRPLDASAFESHGRMTPFSTSNAENAEIEAECWRQFFAHGDSSTATAMFAIEARRAVLPVGGEG